MGAIILLTGVTLFLRRLMSGKIKFALKQVVDLSLHLVITASVGSFFYFIVFPGKAICVFAAIAGGILIDLDHLVDYFYCYGWRFSLQKFIDSEYIPLNKKVFLLLHSWELVIIFLVAGILGSAKVFIPIATAMALHFLVDHFMHKKKLGYYTLIYRWIKGFDTDKIEPCCKD
jgi:hypothetical protein